LKICIQRLMSSARNSPTREREFPTLPLRADSRVREACTKVTGIPYVMDAYREEAEAILKLLPLNKKAPFRLRKGAFLL